jgi:transposase
MTHPEWALTQKKKGTELRCIRGKYYLYEVSSIWDKERKRAVKKTGKCLGTISEAEGFKPSKARMGEGLNQIAINPKVFGAFYFFNELCKDWQLPLKKYFPHVWKQIFCMAYTRLFKRSPIKNMPFFFEQSFFSEYFNGLAFSDKTLIKILRDIGVNQGLVEQYMREFISGDNLVLIDATPIFSKSKNIHEARLGYNNKKQWDSQVNLLYLYSEESSVPLFFKISPGDVREVKTLEHAIVSAGLKNVIIVGDKGFTSKINIDIIESKGINYILPLKRNSSLIDYKGIDAGKSEMESFFKFKDRYVWYKSKILPNNKRVIVFLDDHLRTSEESDYLDRIDRHPEEYNLSGFWEKQPCMGTISTIDNVLDKSPKEVYQTYKSRCEIEQLFDIFKNELEADKTYMHSIESLRGWIFINHLAITAYYRIYKILQSNELLDKFSVNDILEHLYHIHNVRIGEQWKLQAISTKTEKLLKKINISLPITWIRES